MNRREIIKSLSVFPLAGGAMALDPALAEGIEERMSKTSADTTSIYESIGVETIINCRGTFTIIGGSTERPEVIEAIEKATGYFAQYDELAFGIGKKLAKLTGAEWGMVSAGCASAMRHVTTACVARGNPEILIRVPDLTGLEKTEVIIPKHSRNVYDHAIRNVGVTIIEVDSPEELKQAFSHKTAMVYIMTNDASEKGQPLSLEAIAEITKPYNVPILVDAAAEDLTIPNVHLNRGATIVAYSGGKAICGPQCAGLLLGDKDILMSAWQASSPHHGPGRDSKVGKEEMFGMLAAVEAWTTRDHEAEWKTWLSWLDTISQKVTKVKGVTTSIQEPKGLNNRCPRLIISWDPNKLHLTGAEMAKEVGYNAPRIAIGSGGDDTITSVNITPSQMRPGNADVVADRLHGILSQKRKPKSTTLAAPSSVISGRWEVTIDYFSSQSKHSWFLEQDGNWLQGSHQGDFSVREIVGMIEGDQVKLRSTDRHSADSITFIFSGKLTGDTLSGSLYLGEYLNAKFTAKKNNYNNKKKPVEIPGGAPLAT